jgi:hypothetical protein
MPGVGIGEFWLNVTFVNSYGEIVSNITTKVQIIKIQKLDLRIRNFVLGNVSASNKKHKFMGTAKKVLNRIKNRLISGE